MNLLTDNYDNNDETGASSALNSRKKGDSKYLYILSINFVLRTFFQSVCRVSE